MRGRGRSKAGVEQVETVRGYRDMEPIGRGGFSIVYRAHLDRLARTVAVKVLTNESVDAAALRRQSRELRGASQLSGHPHVVSVLDSGRTDWGRPYLAMDYYERGSLADQLAASGPLSVAEVLRVGVKIAGALDAAHQAGILHRDVKPQNILVNQYGEPALADFGTARQTAEEISVRSEALTPFHAAPELLQGGPATAACDIYSLGSTLYQLLAGAPAYRTDGNGIAGLLLAALTGDPPPIARADAPAPLIVAIQTAMAREPAQRFVSVRALAESLQAVQATLGLPVTELPSMTGTGLDAPAARRRLDALAARPGPTVHSADAETVPLIRNRQGRRRSWWVWAAGGVALLALTLAPLALISASARDRSTSDTSPTLAATSPTRATTASAPPTVAAPPPDVTPPRFVSVVADSGAEVSLRWDLAPGTGVYPVLVQATGAGLAPLLMPPLPAGTTSYTVTGLNPQLGYCFQAGLLVAIGYGSTPSSVVWSPATCIRGAVVGRT
jgi:tRNA A-37 threonylcarbamoyl transferase component Bud32